MQAASPEPKEANANLTGQIFYARTARGPRFVAKYFALFAAAKAKLKKKKKKKKKKKIKKKKKKKNLWGQ